MSVVGASDKMQRERFKVAVAGAAFSGAILARQLAKRDDVDVVCFERSGQSSVRKHWTQPVTGAGLNINLNAMATLQQIDPVLEAGLRKIGLPRKSVRACTVTGRKLYEVDIEAEGLANTTGCRVRWDDANTLIRSMAGNCIRWETAVENYQVDADGRLTLSLVRAADGTRVIESGFDLLVASDGRYSAVRNAVNGGKPSRTTFGDVCNFRILVPNAQPEGKPWPEKVGAEGLFDDLTLFYNETPTTEILDKDPALAGSPGFEESVLRSSPRVGVMRIPRSRLKNDVGESLYMFGNFGIPPGAEISDAWKSPEVLQALYTPAEGEGALTPEGAFTRETLTRNADKLHWARFQDTDIKYVDETGKVLLLGDAAHPFCPALG